MVQTACLDRASRDHIGALLRAAYEEVARELIPNEHIDLLLALRHMERERRRELGNSPRPSASDPTCLPDEDGCPAERTLCLSRHAIVAPKACN